MLLTEEKANLRYCCGPYNADVDYHCVGSQCMAWRWGDKPNGQAIYKSMKPGAEIDHYEPRRGYCGLAGKVEQA